MAETNRMRTYLQGDVSQKQRENFQAHMDHLGFDSTKNPGEFEATKSWKMVMATPDELDRRSQLPMHSHTFMEIFQYISDSKVEYLIGTHRYILQKGDIVCVPPGTCHQVLRYEPEDVPCVRNLIAITPSFLEYFGWNILPDQYYLLRTADDKMERLAYLCEMCVREAQEQEPRWWEALSGYVQILLTQIIRNSDASIKAETDGLFENILTYIDNNLGQRITLVDTARHFFISERTITREFQKNLGISFYRYVTKRRLLMAQNLVLNDLSMDEVCQRVGFADYPTFYRAFKKEYGISPRQMKQQAIITE